MRLYIVPIITVACLLVSCRGEWFQHAAIPDSGDSHNGNDINNGSDPENWTLVTELDLGSDYSQIEFVAIYNDWFYILGGSSTGNFRWRLDGNTREELAWTGWPDGYHDGGVSCQNEERLYVLGGGGNSVFSPWHDFHWEVTDLQQQAWLIGGEHGYPVHNPAIANDDGHCILIGGQLNSGTPTSAVQQFLTASETWDSLPALPVEISLGAAALGEGVLLSAGGARSYEPGDSGTSYGVAVDWVYTLDLDAGGRDWQESPALPMPLLLGTCIFVDGRFTFFGGMTNTGVAENPYRAEIWSWSPGEENWQTEGGMPAASFHNNVLVHDGNVYLIVDQTGNHQLYRWLR